MLELVEELHAVTGRLGIPPQALRIDERALNGAGPPASESLDVLARVDQYLGDLDASGRIDPARLDNMTAPAEPDAFLLEGFIRPGTTVMLTGPPGSAKSWATRQLALAAGCGLREFLGKYAITRRLRVLIVDEDNGPDEEWRREEALLAHLSQPRQHLDHVWRVSLAGVQLDQPAWQSWLRGLVHLLALDLVILDPISEMHGGKELREDPGFRSMLGFLKRLKVDFPGLATLLVHHTRKTSTNDRAGPRSLDDVRGQWGQTPDVVAMMWPLPERKLTWELHKRVPHSRLILEATAAGPLQVVADETTSRDRRVTADSRVLAAIESGAETADEIATGSGISRAGVYKAVRRLADAGIITKRAPYSRLTDPTDDPIAPPLEEDPLP
jgi:hypothetical protein